MSKGHTLTPEDRRVRGYSWPPFEPGNMVALRHGGFSEQLAAQTIEEIAPRLLEVAPWLARPEYALAVARYLRSEALALVTFSAIERILVEDGAEAVPERLWQAHNAAANTARREGSVLGLDPASRERIGAARAVDRGDALARLAARGRRMRHQAVVE
jgi:hypothetical protein